ncbi:unnamed protein product [Lampetra fluviatilis]
MSRARGEGVARAVPKTPAACPPLVVAALFVPVSRSLPRPRGDPRAHFVGHVTDSGRGGGGQRTGPAPKERRLSPRSARGSGK